MEVTFFVILGALLLVSLGLGAGAFYKGNKILSSIHESLLDTNARISSTHQTFAHLNAKQVELSVENARLTAELTSLRALNDDLNKSIDILTQQHLS